MSKKNLDKIFQEKFSEFSDIPTEKVWKSIEASLNKKKKTRMVIPFWWKLGGIAAALAIGLFLINPFKNGENGTNTIITDVETLNEKQGINQSATSEQKEVVETTKSDSGTLEELNKGPKERSNIEKTVDTNISLAENDKPVNTEQKQNITKTGIAITKSEVTVEKRNDIVNDVISNKKETEIAANQSKDPNKKIAEGISVITTESETGTKDLNERNIITEVAEEKTDNLKQEIEEGKKSIFDEIEEQKKEEIVAEATKSRWSAGPSIAPVYFDAIGEGSPVHSIFVPNSKSGDINLSYGLAVSYEINKKLLIKTGVHKVDYGYNTNDIEFSSSLEALGGGQIDNIDYSLASRNIVVESKVNGRNSFAENAALDAAAQDPSLLGVMAQQFGYLEIPLELNYSLVDSKFGVNLIGGVSSLFLIDNSVTLTSGELVTKMGEANNVNDVNFSTNVGFGLNYKFSPKVQMNIEPVFKYQLNTFSGTSGDFRPFTIGVYSGLNFKF
ncbi:outer membrane beta-barrel protein [Maribacter sp. HTCC2170]|uniref:outer membrane beta-barrel protein n=1 Tax=Maribacter sp. (strain HTCC2170 / KCCM 42371) TaxID=313603 RepID=UPI00006BD4F1|nr:outer membrane beta-barrel protein [Maribacter sp. HTCC2170]